MLKAPDPALLQTFVTIVESGSFTGAARRVHRTQSAVSMQIRRLEDTLGYSLFERNGQSIRLTAAGEVFYDHARRILADYRSAMGAVGQSELEGDITIGAPDDYVMTFLPKILRTFNQIYPNVRVHIVSEPSRQLVHNLAVGGVDVALLTEGEGSTGGQVVNHEPLAWVGSYAYQTHKQEPVPLAIFHSGDVFRRLAVRALEDTGRHATIVATSSGFAGIYAAVEAGIAIGILFKANVRSDMRILGTEEGFPSLPPVGIILHRSEKESNKLIDDFCKHVLRELRR